MIGTLLLRGMLVGVVAGMLAFAFARVYGEPELDRAIAFEEQVAHAGGDHHHEEEAPVSRQTQAGFGLFTGLTVFGAVLGGVFSMAFAFLHGRLGAFRPLHLALGIALTGFVTLFVVPGLKYPASPPAVGSPETISERTILFFGMLLISAVALIFAFQVARMAGRRVGGWKACLMGLLAFSVITLVAWAALPSVNEVPNGFPTDLLSKFRLASFGVHAVLWAALGIGFGLLTERGLAVSRVDQRRKVSA
ncbi:CbtA family protein [Aminobacter sp. MSH1]|uniref:CbtA family protein n=1 Tax=Aminobacter sp. MSH1 TaxID=374606 RepID=UPI000D36312E|nr:CbtA family protein [Aminobacter sp. MSH1]